MKSLLQVSNIHFRYLNGTASPAALPALDILQLTLQQGEKVALIGANGSGKSTLLLTIAGCLRPAQGSVHLHQQDITGNPQKTRGKIGLLFQQPDVQLLMPSVREELLLSLQGIQIPNPLERVETFAVSLGLTRLLDKPPHRLSTGEKQLAGLGTLLITYPDLLLLDEPSAALDPRSRRALIHFLNQLDTALLIATHDLDFALDTTTRTILMSQGRIIADGATATLLRDQSLLEGYNLELPLSLSRHGQK